MTCAVYFLRPVGAEGPIKIGCSHDPVKRLQKYMSWSPVGLEIAATIAGGVQLEWRFHALLRRSHSHQEWFHPTPEVLAVMDAVRRGAFDISSLPENGWRPSRKNGRTWINGQLVTPPRAMAA